jgi:hypothetical protein
MSDCQSAVQRETLLGNQFEGNYRGRGKWYSCEVTAVREGGHYDIQYTCDKIIERYVSCRNIRNSRQHALLLHAAVRIGDLTQCERLLHEGSDLFAVDQVI